MTISIFDSFREMLDRARNIICNIMCIIGIAIFCFGIIAFVAGLFVTTFWNAFMILVVCALISFLIWYAFEDPN